MIFQLTPTSIAFLLNAILCLALALIVRARRVKPGGNTFCFLMVSLAVWSFASALEAASSDYSIKITFSKLSYLGIATAPPLLLLFAAHYSRKDHWLKTITIIAIFIIPVITLGMVFTNEWHRLIWSSVVPSPGTNGEVLIYNHGPIFWVNGVFSYICLFVATYLIVHAALLYSKEYRSQALIFLIAAIIPWVGNLIYVTGLSPIKGLDITPLCFALSAAILGWGIYRHQLFGIIPIARDLVVENMSDCVIVLDTHNIILDANPALTKMVDRKREELLGKSIADVFKGSPDLINHFRKKEEKQTEVRLKGNPSQIWEMRNTSLRDWNGNITARLLTMHDITSRKKIEQEEHEQRILAGALSDSAAALNNIRNFNEVLDRIMLDVERVVPHDAANISIINEQGKILFVRLRGYKERGFEDLMKPIQLSFKDAPTFRAMATTGKSIFIADTDKDPEWFPTPESAWIRSYAGAPIKVSGEIVGFISLDNATPNFYSQKHSDWLRAFADQAAVAIENAHLFEKVTQNAEEIKSLYDISNALSSGLDLSRVIKELFKQCRKIVDIDMFDLGLYDKESGEIKFESYNHRGQLVHLKPKNINIQPGMHAYIILKQKITYIPDMKNLRLNDRADLLRHFPKKREGSYLGIPLKLRDSVIGVFSIRSNQPNAYNDENIRLLKTIAQQAAIAIENARLFTRMEELAIRDGLTGLYNQRHFAELAEIEILRAVRYKKQLSFIMIDLDHFKMVNDNFGHLVGDQILQLVARNCLNSLRTNDIISRYGGEEFTVLLPETGLKEAIVVAERLRQAINSSNQVTPEGVVKISASLGVAILADCPHNMKSLLECADKALYAAKEAGRDQVAAYKPDKKNTPRLR